MSNEPMRGSQYAPGELVLPRDRDMKICSGEVHQGPQWDRLKKQWRAKAAKGDAQCPDGLTDEQKQRLGVQAARR